MTNATGRFDGAVHDDTSAEIGTAEARRAIAALFDAAVATLRLWDKYGLGDDDAESEPVHQALVNAIAKAKGLI